MVGCSCPRVELFVELREHIRNALSVVFVGASVVFHVCSEDFLSSGVDRGCVFETTEVAQDVCDVLSSCVVFDRAYLCLNRSAGVCVCLHVGLNFCKSCLGDSACSLVEFVLSWEERG